MAITVNTNISAQIAQSNLIKNNDGLNKVLQQLSTGLRINSAKDDAAGLAISVGMTNQIQGNSRAADNIQDGLNLMTTAEGGMEVVTDHLTRVRELCVQAANEIYNTQNKIAILNEMKQRISDVDIQSQSFNFNDIPLLDGTKTSLKLQFGSGTDPALNSLDIGSTLTNMRISAGTVDNPGLDVELNVTTASVAPSGYTSINDWGPDEIMAYMDKLDSALAKITTDRSTLGACSNRLQANYDNLLASNENIQQSRSRILDVDMAAASTQMVKYQILQQSTTAVLGQANQVPQLALSLLQ